MKNPEYAKKEWTEEMLPTLINAADYLGINSLLKDSLNELCRCIDGNRKYLKSVRKKISNPIHQNILLYCVPAEQRRELFTKCELDHDDIGSPFFKNATPECLEYINKNQLHLWLSVEVFLYYDNLEDFHASAILLKDIDFRIQLELQNNNDLNLLVPSLKTASNLNELKIENYEGRIDMSLFPELPKLEKLSIRRSQIYNLDNFLKNEFPELRLLVLSDNGLEKIARIETMPKLKELYLYDNRLQNVKELFTSCLDNLERLTLFNNQIKHIEAIQSMPKLKYLVLFDNQLENVDEFLSSPLFNLKELNLSNNRIKTIKKMFPMPKLQVLELYQNQLTDVSGLLKIKLPELYRLDLRENLFETPVIIDNAQVYSILD